jgi:hypothetical protein
MADKSIAKAKTSSPPAKPSGGGAPPTVAGFQWSRLAIVGGILAALWVTAFATNSKIFVIVVGVITVVVLGGLAWIYRWARKQREMMELLQSASVSPEARREALAKLAAKDGADKDVMNAIARAQLEAQEDPDKALETLEKVDLKKVPATMGDDVRAFRAQLYLLKGRKQEARELADEIKLSQAGSAEARGMLAATVAEAWARTGKHKEALDLLQTIKPDDPDFAQAKVPLLFARIYAQFAAGQRDGVRRDMGALAKQDVNLLGRFVMPQAKVHPELQKMARDVLMKNPEMRKMAQKQQRMVRRPR